MRPDAHVAVDVEARHLQDERGPLISVLIVIPLMQYAVMPALTRAARGFLYPPQRPESLEGAR